MVWLVLERQCLLLKQSEMLRCFVKCFQVHVHVYMYVCYYYAELCNNL